MNFRLIALNIQKFVPMLSIPVIKQRINVRYQQIIGAEDWSFLNDSTTVRLVEQISNTSTESCAVTQGSATVTGTATSWSGIDGYFKRLFHDSFPSFLEIPISRDTLVVPKLSVNCPIEDQDPKLSRKELESNMLISILPESGKRWKKPK